MVRRKFVSMENNYWVSAFGFHMFVKWKKKGYLDGLSRCNMVLFLIAEEMWKGDGCSNYFPIWHLESFSYFLLAFLTMRFWNECLLSSFRQIGQSNVPSSSSSVSSSSSTQNRNAILVSHRQVNLPPPPKRKCVCVFLN